MRLQRITEFSWVALGQLFTFVGGVASVKLLTMYLAPAGYGKFVIGFTVATIMVLLAYGPMTQVVARFFQNAVERKDADTILAWIRGGYLIATVVSAPLIVAAAGALSFFSGTEWFGLLTLSMLLGWLTGGAALIGAMLNASRRRSWLAIQQGLDAFFKPLFALVLIVVVASHWASALIGYILATAVSLIVIWMAFPNKTGRRFFAARRSNSQESERLWGDMNHYIGPFVVFGVVALAGLHGDKFFLQHQIGSAAVGVYAAMYQIANAPVALSLAVLNQFSLPFLFKNGHGNPATKVASSVNRQYRWLLYGSILVLLGTCAALYWFGEWLLEILATPEFAAHHESLWVLGVGLACFHLAQQMHISGFIANAPSIYILPKLLHSVAFVAGAMLVGAKGGVPGVCFAYLVASALYLGAVLIANSRLPALGRPRAEDRT